MLRREGDKQEAEAVEALRAYGEPPAAAATLSLWVDESRLEALRADLEGFAASSDVAPERRGSVKAPAAPLAMRAAPQPPRRFRVEVVFTCENDAGEAPAAEAASVEPAGK